MWLLIPYIHARYRRIPVCTEYLALTRIAITSTLQCSNWKENNVDEVSIWEKPLVQDSSHAVFFLKKEKSDQFQISLQHHQKYNITEYEDIWLFIAYSDERYYTTNSHCPTYTIFRSEILGEYTWKWKGEILMPQYSSLISWRMLPTSRFWREAWKFDSDVQVTNQTPSCLIWQHSWHFGFHLYDSFASLEQSVRPYEFVLDILTSSFISAVVFICICEPLYVITYPAPLLSVQFENDHLRSSCLPRRLYSLWAQLVGSSSRHIWTTPLQFRWNFVEE